MAMVAIRVADGLAMVDGGVAGVVAGVMVWVAMVARVVARVAKVARVQVVAVVAGVTMVAGVVMVTVMEAACPTAAKLEPLPGNDKLTLIYASAKSAHS